MERANGRPAALGHVAALDGVRGLSVLAVMSIHLCAPGWLSVRDDRRLFRVFGGGSVGVDVFFVLSGVLITTLLVQEVDADGRVDATAFRWRRVRRLAPALLISLAAMGVASALGDRDALSGRPWLAVVCVLGLGANWLSAADQNAVGALGVTWSLSIEEQFYLLWPYALVALLRRGGTRLAAAALVVGVAVCAAYTVWAAHRFGLSARFHTPVHGVGLLIGAWGAVVLRSPARRRSVKRAVGSPLLAAGCVVGLALLSRWAVYRAPVLQELLTIPEDVLALVVVLHCVVVDRAGSWVVGALSWRPLTYLGTISYGLYLFHVPVMYLLLWAGVAGATTTVQSAGEAALIVGISVAAAALSYELVERRVRRGGRSLGWSRHLTALRRRPVA